MLGKKGKKYKENKLAEMLALLGGAWKYLEEYDGLMGYEEYYMENRERPSFHYKMQRYADKKIRKELKEKKIYCRKWKTKRFYRYNISAKSVVVEDELFYYFKSVMDEILDNVVLSQISLNNILNDCQCELDSQYDICLNIILDWQYKRLIKLKTNFTVFDEKKKEKAKKLLDKLNNYAHFGDFKNKCQIAHGIMK